MSDSASTQEHPDAHPALGFVADNNCLGRANASDQASDTRRARRAAVEEPGDLYEPEPPFA